MTKDDSLGPRLYARELLEVLDRHGVDFVVIGGVAGSLHGSAYPTFDLDAAYSREGPNLTRLAEALEDLQVTLRGAPPDLPFQIDAKTIANGANFTFDSRLGRFDILSEIDGIRDYESLRSAATPTTLGDLTVRIASIDHLIAMKRAANRNKDKMMLEEYIVIADVQKKLAKEERESEQG